MGQFLFMLPFLAVAVTSSSIYGSQDVSTIAGLSNQFAVDVHKELSNGEENLFFSPISIKIALTMLYSGTKGKTAEEMRLALGYQDERLTDSEVHAAYKNLLELFSEDSEDKEYTWYLENAAFLQKGYPILDDYKSLLQKNYKATARDLDFQNNGKDAVQAINDWVKLKTNGQITELLSDIDPATILVLLNAVYFKGTWKTQFDPEDTSDGVFFNKGLETEQTRVQMMHLTEEFPYRRLGGVRALEIPYKGEDISMIILLPDAMDGLSKLEGNLAKNMMRDIRKNMYKTKVHLTMPKLKLEYAKSLNTVLQNLGIQDIFRNSANLSGISKSGPIAVSDVMHKAVIEVNEEGSEASAITGIIVETRMGGQDNEFVVNHPFLFCIYDTRNEMVLFQGSVNKL